MQQQHVTSQCCHDAAHGYTDPLLIDCSLQYAMPVYLQQLAVAYPDGALTLTTQHLPDLTASSDMSLSSSDESSSDSYVDGHGDRATSPRRIDCRRAGVYEDDEDESEDVVRVADTSPMLDDSFSLSSQHGFAAPSMLNFIADRGRGTCVAAAVGSSDGKVPTSPTTCIKPCRRRRTDHCSCVANDGHSC
ncbi:PREDICTED: uncharacterized protein LOC106815676 [Priapulus caudatus]|uniref:Uncharacterized protein LOC106815676 n=1 Tax=Priapulus caudatus TaxID=37621 RepID=A0ABM1ETZ2_PRICU|nr:PREDICTED: uncharacterized protein LOC106815676 [Priapulus caudatus]